MNWLDKMQRKFGRWAIPNLMNYIVILNAIVYLLTYLGRTSRIINSLTLEPALVMQGEIWRLVSYIFIPPMTSPIWIIFTLYFYYLVGNGLEQAWGSFKFNFYYLVGMIATTLVAFLTGGGATAIYLNLSLFLAFAYVFPNFEVLLFFIIPVKVKYLAWLNWIFIAYAVFTQPFHGKLIALASIVNYLLFFGKDLLQYSKRRREVYNNRRRFQDASNYEEPVHVCEFCGMTEKTDPNMVFQHCSECSPQYEYCTKHINNHKHIL